MDLLRRMFNFILKTGGTVILVSVIAYTIRFYNLDDTVRNAVTYDDPIIKQNMRSVTLYTVEEYAEKFGVIEAKEKAMEKLKDVIEYLKGE